MGMEITNIIYYTGFRSYWLGQLIFFPQKNKVEDYWLSESEIRPVRDAVWAYILSLAYKFLHLAKEKSGSLWQDYLLVSRNL